MNAKHRVYRGVRWPDRCVVLADGEPLSPRNDLFNHSPSGFEWGYPGSGPAQLALALLADHFALRPESMRVAKSILGIHDAIAPMPGEEAVFAVTSDELAVRLHQKFKAAVVAGLPRIFGERLKYGLEWELTSNSIDEALGAMERAKEMRLALSLHQPWAWAIIHGGKDIENRSWPTRVRGEVIIHATKRFRPDEIAEALDIMAPHLKGPPPSVEAIGRQVGGVVGRVRIVDCVTQSESPWFMGPYGFVLEDQMPLGFVQWPGARGFWPVPEELLGRIRTTTCLLR